MKIPHAFIILSVSQLLPLVAYLRGLAYSFLGFSSCQPRKNNKQIVQWENNCSRSAKKKHSNEKQGRVLVTWLLILAKYLSSGIYQKLWFIQNSIQFCLIWVQFVWCLIFLWRHCKFSLFFCQATLQQA